MSSKNSSPIGRAPKVIALENVLGTLTSHGGRDFAAICQTFANAGYRYGALVINAALFVPQSRPRLFVIGVRDDVAVSGTLIAPGPIDPFHPPALRRAVDRISGAASKKVLSVERAGAPTTKRRVRGPG